MQRAYYSNTIKQFIADSEKSILGELSLNHSNRTLEDLQKNAWVEQITILKDQLTGIDGQIYFEFAIPRMGKRVDNIVIINNVIFIIEFKVGSNKFNNFAIDQVIDYAIDLKNFHQGSHNARLIPILISTEGDSLFNKSDDIISFKTAAKANKSNLFQIFNQFSGLDSPNINVNKWENSIYKPTPTIIEAAQALYKGHNVKEITRSDSGAINLSITTDCINSIIDNSKSNNSKSICFVTGVPGAGKTLAGLNIANERMNIDEDEHAVFLSGNGPLVLVLREALTRDEVLSSKQTSKPLTKKQAAIKTNAFIQNIHHFRDEYLRDKRAPIEKVVVFDEAQRAWSKHQTSFFMKRKKGIDNFEMSEPEFLIDVMNRHSDWCTIVCLIGGGQEINTGEAGILEWIKSLKEHYQDWNIFYSNLIIEEKEYFNSESIKEWVSENGIKKVDLHLAVNIRSFRTEKLSKLIRNILDLNIEESQRLYNEIKNVYPIVLTRNLSVAKKWLRKIAKGSERIGLISSSGARRLRPFSIDVKNEISAPNWFLNNKHDIRSSYFLEEIATEFDIQGLEIDYACVAWGGNFSIINNVWKYQNFKGTKWQNINKEVDKDYLKNTYRVLLTRARQGIVIFLPKGSDIDHTRPARFYDGTFNYLREIGIKEIDE